MADQRLQGVYHNFVRSQITVGHAGSVSAEGVWRRGAHCAVACPPSGLEAQGAEDLTCARGREHSQKPGTWGSTLKATGCFRVDDLAWTQRVTGSTRED